MERVVYLVSGVRSERAGVRERSDGGFFKRYAAFYSDSACMVLFGLTGNLTAQSIGYAVLAICAFRALGSDDFGLEWTWFAQSPPDVIHPALCPMHVWTHLTAPVQGPPNQASVDQALQCDDSPHSASAATRAVGAAVARGTMDDRHGGISTAAFISCADGTSVIVLPSCRPAPMNSCTPFLMTMLWLWTGGVGAARPPPLGSSRHHPKFHIMLPGALCRSNGTRCLYKQAHGGRCVVRIKLEH